MRNENQSIKSFKIWHIGMHTHYYIKHTSILQHLNKDVLLRKTITPIFF